MQEEWRLLRTVRDMGEISDKELSRLFAQEHKIGRLEGLFVYTAFSRLLETKPSRSPARHVSSQPKQASHTYLGMSFLPVR